jgi:hypothetical protein
MLGNSYPFVVVVVFVVAMAILAFVSRGGLKLFLGAMAGFLFFGCVTFGPLILIQLPSPYKSIVLVLGSIITASLIGHELYQKRRSKTDRRDPPQP